MRFKMAWEPVKSTLEGDYFDLEEGDQIIQIDWLHTDFTQRRRVLGLWIARPVDG